MNGKVETISATAFQRQSGKYTDGVHGGEYGAVIVAAHGRPQVAIISVAEYDSLMAAKRELAERNADGARTRWSPEKWALVDGSHGEEHGDGE